MKLKKKITNEAGRDRYLVTYADLITLLLALFVILYSASQVDQEKYEQVKKAFSKVFVSNGKGVLNGGEGILNNKSYSPITQVELDTKSLDKLYSEANVTLNHFIKDGSMNIRYNGTELVLSLSDDLLFASGSEKIKENGHIALDTLTKILQKYDKFVTVDGHTDNVPISNNKFGSFTNWDLSVKRALEVGKYLIYKDFPERNIAIRGFAENRPIAENSTDEGKKKNRRVEISISEIPINLPSTLGYEKK